ncbi:MAG TPA: CCA tRNA nucleotidyltransferase, partial [Anaeromyxobacteraceae bacterium]|nr:CCA tRNA nucleotidyltransferase [Anaeromyxobacteraceae bacterium]
MERPSEMGLRAREVPAEVRAVLARLGEAGHRSWLVGGVVRDLLLRRERHDPSEFDVATPATPSQVQALFRKVIPTGIDHGTVTVVESGQRIEVTTFRGEEGYEDGRRPSRVTFHDDLEADLARRDFTVNAMAWDPLADELRDPSGGRRDLARRVIRCVGDARARFAEDGLRPLRAARFVAQLGFRLAPDTRAAIPGALPIVALVSRERVAEELSRLLVGPAAAAGLATLRATGLLGVVLPRLAALPPGRVRHAIAVASEPFVGCAAGRGADRERCRLLRMAALLHVLPPEEAMQAVVELRLPNRLATGVVALSGGRCGLDASGPPAGAGAAGARRWIASVGREQAPLFLALWEADARHQGARSAARSAEVRRLSARVRRELAAGVPLSLGELALGGRDVMALLPGVEGKQVGEALRALLDEVLGEPSLNTKARLSERLRAWG